jgi:hypothetical protein
MVVNTVLVQRPIVLKLPYICVIAFLQKAILFNFMRFLSLSVHKPNKLLCLGQKMMTKQFTGPTPRCAAYRNLIELPSA